MFFIELVFIKPIFQVPKYVWAGIVRVCSARVAWVLAALPWVVYGLLLNETSTRLEAVASTVDQFFSLYVSQTLVALWDFRDMPLDTAVGHACLCIMLLMAWMSLGSTVWLGPLHLWVVLWEPRVPKQTSSHGSAAWGGVDEARHAKRLWPCGFAGGLMLGRVWGKMRASDDSRYRVTRHVLTCAPTGAGKGVGCVIPNLLAYPGAVVCLDVKGENFAITAQVRREMGQDVFVLDPFGMTGNVSHQLNWLDAINIQHESCVSDAAALAETLVVRDAGHDGYWDDAAAHLLQGVLLYVASLPDVERHMGTLRHLLTQPDAKLVEDLRNIADQKNLAYGIAARAACSFLGKADRERSAVLSTALRHTAFLDDPRIDRVLRKTQIEFAQLKVQPATVYIVLPPDKLVAYSRFARATLGLAMQAMMRWPGRPEHDVLFLLDEFAQLGHFAAVEQNIAILRGYGASLWLLVQDLSQLRGVYSKWESFLANTVLQAFGTQDMHTARYLSDMLGHATLQIRSGSTGSSTGPDGGASNSLNEAYSAHGRALLTPDEVRRLPEHQVLVFEQGQPPQLLVRLDYRTDPETKGALPANPMYARSVVESLQMPPPLTLGD